MTGISIERIPVESPSDLDRLDETEMLEGYRDGYKNERCGDNRSRSYWHGWRNGMVDGKHAKGDAAQAKLATAVVARNKKPPANPEGPTGG